MDRPGATRGEITGRVVVAQEDRMRLLVEGGRSLLITLGPRSGPGMEEIHRWAREGSRVWVRYRGDPDSGVVAEAVRPL